MESCCSQFFYEDDSDANNSQLSHWWYIALTSSHRRSQTILASVSGFGQIRFWKETIRISWSVFLIVNKSVVTGSVCHSEHQNHSNHCNALLHSAPEIHTATCVVFHHLDLSYTFCTICTCIAVFNCSHKCTMKIIRILAYHENKPRNSSIRGHAYIT